VAVRGGKGGDGVGGAWYCEKGGVGVALAYTRGAGYERGNERMRLLE